MLLSPGFFTALRPLLERRRKRSPLRDLAWLVQSLELAAFKVLLDPASVRDSDRETARPWALYWISWTSAALLRAYVEATAGHGVLAVDRAASAVLFEAFRFERALYQLQGALDASSRDVALALQGIARRI